jgi:hypothetical protein
MTDHILAAFLERQLAEGTALAAESDILELRPFEPASPQHYVARFHCQGLVRTPAGLVAEAERFVVGVWFPDDYLRVADPFTVLTLLEPWTAHHPNIRAPFICVGAIAPGTGLVDILYRCWEVITFRKVTMREDDALDHQACAWARHHQHLFPTDARPLKRRAVEFGVEVVEGTR